MKPLHTTTCCTLIIASILVTATRSFAADTPSGPAILQDVKSFRQMATVLMIAAHPDDENTQLITYLARGRGYRMGYLSVTRGDGGQNLLGPEFGEQLGAIRTQELLAARRLDSGRQFFTRAIDFGYSKDFQETLRTWDRAIVLGDVVRVLRTFRPDVVVTRFSTQPAPGQHGQHTSSAVLGVEAFKIAGDPSAYPEQLVGDIKPWKPKRIFLNGGGGGRGGAAAPATNSVRMDVGGNDPVLGISYAEIAGRSRGMHKSQGFGAGGFGGAGGGARSESFQLLDGEPATNDIMDGIDTTWARVPGGAEIGTLVDDAIAKFKPDAPADSVPALLAIHSKLTALPADAIIKEKRQQLDRIIQACIGLTVRSTIPLAEVVPGSVLTISHTAQVTSNIPVKWLAVRYPAVNEQVNGTLDLKVGEIAARQSNQTLPAATPISSPYWLREDHPVGVYQVSDPKLIGTAENPPSFPVEQVFEVGGQTIVLNDEPVQAVSPQNNDAGRRLDVIAPVSLDFNSEVRLFAPGETKQIEVGITPHQTTVTGSVHLDAPAGWKVMPASQKFKMSGPTGKMVVPFTVTAPSTAASVDIGAHVEMDGARFNNQRIEIRYDHIPVLLLQPSAKIKAVALEMKTKGREIGYVPGAGDSVAECLNQMGYHVTELSANDLTAEKLGHFDAIVFGVRAFNANVRTDLAPHLDAVYAYIEAGGTVVAQYNRPETGATVRVGPYPVRISADRITDETAAPTLLVPEHPAFNSPNKITPADFDGWVQERGIYFPNSWDEHFTPLLAFSDPGEQPQKGALLVAPYGKGYFVYSGLVWFRELPAGVPGAYRLFANLLSLGK